MSFNVSGDELVEELEEFARALKAAPAGTAEDPKWARLLDLLGLVVGRLTYDDREACPLCGRQGCVAPRA